ncbi:uncharacterized protein LOC132394519 isoform X1 [Hypanus sabinus]|uniref:uncharacterized protein LOC132394519 isoform X1 n=1 Tax=Hypanus sabinus TaxID=79690 RepID=UPI0028C38F17|nr:uncharacterized protein LOC132394519 isoform X1 [Hypanus sabinus]
MLLLLLQFVLVVVNAEDKGKQKVGVLGSSVLLDPELKVDPSKSEKVWTFNGRSILLHVPGHSSVEPSDQFKFRLHFNTSNGALTVNGAERGDQGNYTFIVGGQELRIIQLRLFDKLSKASISTNIKSLGFTVELTCDVFGDPYVYQWQKNGGEISQRHQLTDGNRTLVISGSSCEDRGVYTCITTNPASSIQTNYTLMLRGFSLNGVILIAVLTAGQVISAASLQSAVLPDQRRWKTLGGCLGYRFYFLILWICNTLSLIAMYIVFVYWSVVGGISQLDLVVICVMIIGLQLSSLYINALPYVSKIWELLEGSHTFRILSRNISVFYTILKDCVIVAWIINITSFGLPTVGIVSFVLSFVLPIAFILIPECLVLKKELDKDRVKEEVGLVGSSVLLDPELKVDPSKSEIVWTFNGRSILHHVPGRSLVELSDQFKFRLHFDTANAALTVNGAEHGDQGVYTFIVDGQELRIIQLRLFDKVKQEVGVLGSSVLLDPELKVDPSKSEISWTFNGRSILNHVPGHSLVEQSDQFKIRLHFNTSNGALTVNGSERGDQGDYTFIVDRQELRIIQLRLFDRVKEEVGLVGSSVLLDPELKVDPSKSEISWTFNGKRILHHVPGCSLVEQSEQFKFRLHFNTSNGALTVNGAGHGDQGNYSFMVDGQELRIIQLRLFDKVKQEVGVPGCSVLLDPELKVDPSKSEIIWTFNGRSILHHVPGHSLVELSDQFKFRLHFNTSNGAVTVNGTERGDPGVYTFIVDGQERRVIQLHLIGDSIKDVLIDGLWTVLLIFPVIGVICLSHLIWKYPQKVFLFLGGYLNLIFLLGISVSNLTPGFYSKDTVTIAVSITMVVLLVVVFISLLILWWKARRYYNGDRFQRQISVYNVGFLLVIVIATISWMVFKGLRPEDVGVVITLMVGLVFPAAYAIIFMCWSRKEYPDDKRWWWCLNICNIVALVFILIAFICWIVSEDQSCKTNIPIWILLALFGVTVVIALSRFFPVCSRNKGTNENNRADKKQDCGEVQELQTLSPGHEAEPENHAVC